MLRLRMMYDRWYMPHEGWLRRFNPELARSYRHRLRARDSVQGAIWEALVRHALERLGESVEPAEDPASGGIDFLSSRAGHDPIGVECRCRSIEAVTASRKGIHMPEWPPSGASHGWLARFLSEPLQRKAKQAAPSVPVILAFGTLHVWGRVIAFGDLGAEHLATGESGGRGAMFHAHSDRGIVAARRSISAVLMCGPSVQDPMSTRDSDLRRSLVCIVNRNAERRLPRFRFDVPRIVPVLDVAGRVQVAGLRRLRREREARWSRPPSPEEWASALK
jgi:hypothetical protein